MSMAHTHSDIQDLIFELTDVGQPKLCIGACDDSSTRDQIEMSIADALRTAETEVERVVLSSRDTDLVEVLERRMLLHRSAEKSSVIFIVDGLARMGARSLNQFLGNLNFRRDLLFRLSSPILLWVTSRVLPVMIARAPDFWSRRTATYYFTRSTVRDLLIRLFGVEGTPEVSTDGVSMGIQKILITEGELNKSIRTATRNAPLEVKHLLLAIKDGVETLLEECKQGKRFQVALALWTLTRIDDELYRIVRHVPQEMIAPYENLYEDRNEILLGLSERLPDVFERYKKGIDVAVERRRRVSLLAMFYGAANRLMRHWWRARENYEGRFKPEIFSTEEVWGPGVDEDMHPEEDWDKGERRPTAWVRPRDLTEVFRAQAADELRAWLERENDRLPKVFSKEEGQLLRLMYERSFDPIRIAKTTARPLQEVRRDIEALRGKVHAFLGVT